jgi:uroporphyrinogen-III synthase
LRIAITRPIEDATVLKAKLETLGHETILAPLLTIVPLAGVTIPDEPWQAIAITSANAMRTAPATMLKGLHALPMLTVGPQSALAARHAGFSDIQQAGGDAAGLAKHIASSRDPERGPILYLSGREQAADFAGLLGKSGFAVTRAVLYDALPAKALPSDVYEAEAVVLYSPRTARIWVDLAGRAALDLPAIRHFCLSANVAAILPAGSSMIVAARPTESAMIEAIGRHGRLA